MLSHLLSLLLLSCLLGACAVTGVRPQPDGLRSTHWGETRIAWENRGGGEEALVFVHGWAGDHTLWEKQMESLSPWRRIALDLPGHGASDKPRIEYRVDVMVEALLAVLDDAHVSRAVLVGHSNGALTVRRFLELHPERVAGLVLVDGPLKSFFESPAQGRAFVAPLAGPGWKEWATKFVDGMLAPMHDAADRQHVRAVMLGTQQHVMLSSFEGTLEPELWREQPIRVPLMLVLARQPAWDEAYRAFAEKLAPGLRWEMLEGVSHFLMLDEPERLDALLRSFLVENAPFGRR
jgi:pimeloyl-ACP methyl ester carboxylesterase